jgi:hypothetical protein
MSLAIRRPKNAGEKTIKERVIATMHDET